MPNRGVACLLSYPFDTQPEALALAVSIMDGEHFDTMASPAHSSWEKLAIKHVGISRILFRDQKDQMSSKDSSAWQVCESRSSQFTFLQGFHERKDGCCSVVIAILLHPSEEGDDDT